ncbi:MAG: class I SAM-dependent methyltransferase [Deinococcales bacterium]
MSKHDDDHGDERRMIDANRQSWEEHARLHESSQLPQLLEAFRDPAFTTLDAVELGIYRDIGVAGKRALQVCCNNGRELVSLLRLGASEGVGVDLAEGNLAAGRRLAQAAGLADRVRFVRGDALDLPDGLGRFQLVTITVGALGWLPRLAPLFDGIAARLDAGGRLFVYEMHPVLDMFDADTGPSLRHDYFTREPYRSDGGPDYYEPDKRIEAASYWFHHTLGDVIGGCLAAGLAIERFEEYPHDISMVYRDFERLSIRPPLSYALVARKD